MLWLLISLSYLLVEVSAQGQGPVFTNTPSDVVAAKGAVAELICHARGTPTLRYEWFHNGKRISSTNRRHITKIGSLYFSRVLHKKKKGSDTGSYYCTVTNDYGRVQSTPVNLTLGWLRSSFRRHPLSQSVSLGGKIALSCTPPRGKPKPQLKWFKDKQNVLADGTRVTLENKNQKLIIENFEKDDEGTYKCEATNVVGRILSNPAIVARNAPPVFIEKPRDVTQDVGKQVTFTCKARGNPAPNIAWKKDGNDTVLPSTNGKLIFPKLKRSNEGAYICTAQNSEGSVTVQARVTVNYPPEFIIVPSDAHEMEDKILELLCLANGRPDPRIRWRNKATGKYYNLGHNIRIDKDNRAVSLIISPLRKSDAGTYTCEADNYLGISKHDVNVLVYNQSEYAPSTTIDIGSQTADINSNTSLICDVDGKPKPSVKWYKVGQYGGLGDGIILRDYPHGKKQRYVLNIPRVQANDAGTFQCQAVNKINIATEDAVLQVTRKLKLSESIGTGVPAIPTDVKVSDWTDNSVLINWNAGQGGSTDRIFAYAIGYINVDERSSEKYASYNVVNTRYVVKHLKPNTNYRFFVRGININGRGPPSLLSDVVKTKIRVSTTPTVTTTPSKKFSLENVKLKIHVRPGGVGKLKVSWDDFKEAQIIDGYYIYWKYEGGGTGFQRETLKNSQTNRYILSDLQSSTVYAVRVLAFKQRFLGEMSEIAYNKTTDEAVSLIMSVFQNDSDSIVVNWQQLWKKDSGEDEVKNYTIWYVAVSGDSEEKQKNVIAEQRYHLIIGDLDPGLKYKVWMTATTAKQRVYQSNDELITLNYMTLRKSSKGLLEKIKSFVLQPWFLGVLGGILMVIIVSVVLYCCCKRSSSKKDSDDFPIQLQERIQPESVRKPSESRNTESDVVSTRSRGRETPSECDSMEARTVRVYRPVGIASPNTPCRTGFDLPEIAVTPNKYDRISRSPDGREADSGVRNGRQHRQFTDDVFESPSRINPRNRNPYSPSPKPAVSFCGESRSDYDNPRAKKNSNPKQGSRGNPYPGEAPPDYETAILGHNPRDQSPNSERHNKADVDADVGRMPYNSERYGNPSSRQSSYSPGSECSNQGSSVAGRRKGLKPLPRLTIASVNWADMLPPPPSHPPPSSVATRSPPPSPTATSMCSETTYGRSHSSSFLPRRSGSVVSGDLERATTESCVSGKSKGKSENKLPFDLSGITSDIIMQWADSVTNTSGSDESPCSSPSRVSGISSDGSFLTDTDFANAVKAAAECGGFNIDIDLNMYKDMDPISFQPFAGSLSTYNAESGEYPNKDSKPPSKKTSNGGKVQEGTRDTSRSGRTRRVRTAPPEETRDLRHPSNSSTKEASPLLSSTPDAKNNKKTKKANEVNADGSSGYVPALTRTSALAKLEPVNRGPIKKKFAVVKTLPLVQVEDEANYPANYPSNSLSSSTSNASTIRSSSCPPVVLTDDEVDDYVL